MSFCSRIRFIMRLTKTGLNFFIIVVCNTIYSLHLSLFYMKDWMYPSKNILVRFMQKCHAVFIESVGNCSFFSVICKVVLTVLLLVLFGEYISDTT